jgi:hypothetical protein
MTTTELRAVLDVSALLSYAREHVHVGEILIEINNDGGQVGIPATALFDAFARLTDNAVGRDHLGLLVTLPGAVVLDLGRSQARGAADVVPLVKGDLAKAHVVWAALQHMAYLFTVEPEGVPNVVNREQIVPIPEADA